jgi:predicted RNA-binding protein (virulence factor B family)
VQPLKAFSQLQIEETIANALSELTGANFKATIRKIERIGTCLYDENAIELLVKSEYSEVFAERDAEETASGK